MILEFRRYTVQQITIFANSAKRFIFQKEYFSTVTLANKVWLLHQKQCHCNWCPGNSKCKSPSNTSNALPTIKSEDHSEEEDSQQQISHHKYYQPFHLLEKEPLRASSGGLTSPFFLGLYSSFSIIHFHHQKKKLVIIRRVHSVEISEFFCHSNFT